MENISDDIKKQITDIYFDPQYGFTTAQNIYEKLDKKIKLKDIKLILDNININQTKEKNNNKKKLYIPIVQVPNSYQCDLTFYNQYAKNNNGYGILLVIININSKYIYVYPLKNKNTDTIINCFKDFLNKVKDVKILECDMGSEFISNKFKSLIESHNIELILFNKLTSPNSMAIVERMNSTIRSKIDKYLKAYDTYKYVDVLNKIVNNINNTKSYSTGFKPKDVNEEIEKKIYGDKSMKKIKIINEINNTFKVGDIIKLLKEKKLFSKGSKNYYSKNSYEIIDEEKDGQKFKIKKLKDGSIKTALPYQMKKVNNKNIIENPFIKDKKILDNEKKIFEKNKKDINIDKKLKKEGLKETIDKQKLNTKLLKQGINVNNIIKK